MRGTAASGARRASRRSRLVLVVSVLSSLVLSGCSALPGGGGGPGDLADLPLGDFEPIAIAATEDTRAAGVRAVPLAPGESLAFVFPSEYDGEWTMEGVPYPLVLHRLDAEGASVETVRMRPGKCCFETDAAGFVFVEVRPRRSQ